MKSFEKFIAKTIDDQLQCKKMILKLLEDPRLNKLKKCRVKECQQIGVVHSITKEWTGARLYHNVYCCRTYLFGKFWCKYHYTHSDSQLYIVSSKGIPSIPPKNYCGRCVIELKLSERDFNVHKVDGALDRN